MGLWSKLQLSRVYTWATMADDQAARKAELNDQLKEYISEWRKTREKEEEELQKLKEKQAKRKEIRAEQEKKLNAQKKEEEEKLRKEEAEKKAKEAEEKKKRLEEAEAKRQAMLEAQKAGKADSGSKSGGGGGGADKMREMTKTKEQLEEEKKIALSIRIKPLDLESMDSDEMKSKAEELFKIIVQLETDKYDYEQRKVTQDYELQELKERQKAQLRQKALKKGLDPDAFCGKYPPPIRMYSKYERRTDTRSYEDRKKLYEGGWEVIRAETLDSAWKEKFDEWSKRPAKRLPKWFGERPGKKKGDPESAGDEDDAGEEAPIAEEDYEEEEEEEDYDEEE